MERKVKIVHSFEEADRLDEEYYDGLTPEQRIGMMWQLALDAWAIMGKPVHDQRMRRDIVRKYTRKK